MAYAKITRDLTQILERTSREMKIKDKADLHPDKPYWVPIVEDPAPIGTKFQNVTQVTTILEDQVRITYDITDKPANKVRDVGRRQIRTDLRKYQEEVTADHPPAAVMIHSTLPPALQTQIDADVTKLEALYTEFRTARQAIISATNATEVAAAVQTFRDWIDANPA